MFKFIMLFTSISLVCALPEINDLAAAPPNHSQQSLSMDTYEGIVEAYNAGVMAGATHMLTLWDVWSYEGFVVYAYSDTEFNSLVHYYSNSDDYELTGTYKLTSLIE